VAWTENDLTAVQTAIMELVNGKAVVSASFGGQTISYTRADLDKLRALRAEMMREVEDASPTRSRIRLTSNRTGKGTYWARS